MKVFLSFIAIAAVIASCSGKHDRKLNDTLSDTSKKVTSVIETPDSSDDTGPSFDEVKKEYLSTYNKIDTIDRLIVDGKDTLHLFCKYYCLHDSLLTLPALYDWSGKEKKEFTTHNFVTKIVLVNNRDTVFNRVNTKADFNDAINEEERKYGILFSPDYIGYDKNKGEVAIGYSISIPMTDVGVPAWIAIDKKGEFRILNEYAKTDDYKK